MFQDSDMIKTVACFVQSWWGHKNFADWWVDAQAAGQHILNDSMKSLPAKDD